MGLAAVGRPTLVGAVWGAGRCREGSWQRVAMAALQGQQNHRTSGSGAESTPTAPAAGALGGRWCCCAPARMGAAKASPSEAPRSCAAGRGGSSSTWSANASRRSMSSIAGPPGCTLGQEG